MEQDFYATNPLDEMAEQLFPSMRSQIVQSGGRGKKPGGPGGNLRPLMGDIPIAGSGLPFMAPYVPGVSGMRMVGTGGMPTYGGLTTQQVFSGAGE